ncbi:MAG TPA: ABC transporter permease, partial [Ktedonobacteraceae bacterium]|nr:ABC transporter permease [Ktedonobacteraceae bacterium]
YKLFFLVTGSNISAVNLYGSVFHNLDTESSLEKFQSQVAILRTPSLLLTALILCLVLFFISTMVSALVGREQASIAVMRSRGADRLQIFASLLAQGLALCILAALAGPPLALGLVYLLVPHLFTATSQDAINALVLDPGPVLRSLSLYTLAAVAITFLTLLFSLLLAVRANILTLRREESRTTRLPFWQRLRLDVGVALLAVGGYVLTFYLQKTQSLLDAQSQSLVSAPLQLLPPILLLLAGVLFFLRLFPLLLRLLVRLTRHQQSLTSTMAFVQMERSPHQPMRMALMLGLAIAFAFFSLTFSASQGQRAVDITNYQAVSDFSGYSTSLPSSSTPGDAAQVLSSTTTLYREISGVVSATVGYIDRRYLPVGNNFQQSYMRKAVLSAVDADTFAHTAIWNAQDSSQSLNDLMSLLISQRSQAFQRGVVPAIVATSTWELLDLTPGTIFYLADDAGDPDSTPYVALAEVNHIPPIDDAVQGALLVDYQSLVAGRAQHRKSTQPNYIWLKTSDNPLAISHVRAALSDPNVALDNLVDRFALNKTNTTDPLADHLLIILSIGVTASLLLAFLANLLLPLLNVRARQTYFAVLRALGTPPRQIRQILTWELAIVLITSLFLGLIFGALLAFSSVPPLIFTSVLPANLVDISSTAVFTSQAIIPVTIVLPSSLFLAMGILLALCLLTLGLMTRLAQRPLMSEMLLLDDDG